MSADTGRQAVHARQITCRAFRLTNGWLEIEATLTDEKHEPVPFRSRPPVQPGSHMHSMSLLLTVDADFLIRDLRVFTLTAPWAMCGGTDEAYRKLVGLRIGPGFTREMKKRVGGVEGCTHVTELVAQAANTYMQASWPDRIARQMAVAADPRQWPDRSAVGFINHCHAWREDGETLAQEYPELVPDDDAPPG